MITKSHAMQTYEQTNRQTNKRTHNCSGIERGASAEFSYMNVGDFMRDLHGDVLDD